MNKLFYLSKMVSIITSYKIRMLNEQIVNVFQMFKTCTLLRCSVIRMSILNTSWRNGETARFTISSRFKLMIKNTEPSIRWASSDRSAARLTNGPATFTVIDGPARVLITRFTDTFPPPLHRFITWTHQNICPT